MRNIDRVKTMEKELGRYRKKVADQSKEIQGLRKELEEMIAGNRETQMLVNALLGQLALRYGEAVQDPDSGETIGTRLRLSMFDVKETLDRYEVHARRDEKEQEYVIGVAPREEK